MVSDGKAIEGLKILSDYCLEHKCCKGCMFAPKDYKAEFNECILEQPPCDAVDFLRRDNRI